MKLFISVLLLLLSACSNASHLQAGEAQAEIVAETICVPIGLNGESLELCVDNLVGSPMYYQTNLFYLKTKTGRKSLDLGGGFSTYELIVSPSRRYMVDVENIGEGHGAFSVVDLDDLRSGKSPERCAGIEAYPSGFWDLEWQKDILYFTAGVDLVGTHEPASYEDEFVYRYRIYPAEGCRLEQVGEPVPVTQ